MENMQGANPRQQRIQLAVHVQVVWAICSEAQHNSTYNLDINSVNRLRDGTQLL
jgi:hypothetical protein